MSEQYDSTRTADDVLEGVDLTGRRVVITGAATGLGRETARSLAAHGASVTVLARSAARAEEAASQLGHAVPGAEVDPGVVDLGDLATVRAFTDAYLDRHDHIDVLINNAGVMACPFGRTADGFEIQFGTNHLGHFLLTARLAPALLRSAAPRVVTLSSAGHSRSDVDLEDPDDDRARPVGVERADGGRAVRPALNADRTRRLRPVRRHRRGAALLSPGSCRLPRSSSGARSRRCGGPPPPHPADP